jgi:hypothetical protein
MSEHEPKIEEQPRVEEHRVFMLLALPIFLVSVLIIVLIATLGVR